MIFLRTQLKKIAILMCLCYSVLHVSFVLHCCVKQRTLMHLSEVLHIILCNYGAERKLTEIKKLVDLDDM